MRSNLILFTLILIPLIFIQRASSATSAANLGTEPLGCESAKEFITTFEFLRDHLDLAGSGDNAVKLASQVSAGCTGAAKRFIQTAKFMKKVDLPLTEILSTSVEFAQKEDSHADAFNQIFKRAYAEDGFDLDMVTSLQLAKKISVEYPGNVQRALKDFETVSEFCLKKTEVTVSRQACAELAKNISLNGKEKAPMASEVFIEAYRYIKTTIGLTAHDALKISQDLVKIHPLAFSNFKLSYEYAISDKGLKSNKEQSVLFGKKMAEQTKNSSAN